MQRNNILIRKHKKKHGEVKKSCIGDKFKCKGSGVAKKEEIINTIIDKLGISEDIVMGAEIISMIGRRNLLIENYVKVSEYEDEKIVVRTRRNHIYILGDNLKIEYLLDDEIRISGRISSITLE